MTSAVPRDDNTPQLYLSLGRRRPLSKSAHVSVARSSNFHHHHPDLTLYPALRHVYPQGQPHRLLPPKACRGRRSTRQRSMGTKVRSFPWHTPQHDKHTRELPVLTSPGSTAKHGDTPAPSLEATASEAPFPVSVSRSSRSRVIWSTSRFSSVRHMIRMGRRRNIIEGYGTGG